MSRMSSRCPTLRALVADPLCRGAVCVNCNSAEDADVDVHRREESNKEAKMLQRARGVK